MISAYLGSRFKQGKLYNSWLINADNTATALEDLQVFIRDTLLGNSILLPNHPDYRLITREISSTINTKNISVEQIRTLQEFLNKTSAISGYKVAIIYQADLMNLNAANSCLKILEDTPKNSYIFLITNKAASILTTIRSRCAKININSEDNLVASYLYLKFIEPIANYSNIDMRLNFIQQFSTKNRELWADFVDSILHLMNRITKKSVGINIELTKLEYEIYNRLQTIPPNFLIQKFVNIRRLIHNTIDYDLDLRASCVLLMDEFL